MAEVEVERAVKHIFWAVTCLWVFVLFFLVSVGIFDGRWDPVGIAVNISIFPAMFIGRIYGRYGG